MVPTTSRPTGGATTVAKVRGSDAGPPLDGRTAWSCVAALFMGPQNHSRFNEAAQELGLTAGALKALLTIHHHGEQPMRDLATALHCDASMITQIVDALEARGLAERVPSPTDRRVKLVRLTRAGHRAFDRAMAHLSVAPEAVLRLSAQEQATLARLLLKALSLADPPIDPPNLRPAR